MNRIHRLLGLLPLPIALAVGSAQVHALDPSSTPVFAGVPHDTLYALSFDGRDGVAVGDFGLIVDTSDGGKTWRRQDGAPTGVALLSVKRKDGRCIAVGQSGSVIASDDCRRWAAVPPLSNARLLSVSLAADGTAYAVGAFGTIQKSADWGRTWQALSPDWKRIAPDGAEPHLYDVHVADSGEVTVVGEFELVIRSRDGGRTWAALHTGKRSLFSLFVAEDGTAYAVGQEGALLKGTRNGTAWTAVSTGTSAVLTGVWAERDRISVAGIYTVLHSSDAGRSWVRDTSRIALAGVHQAIAAVRSPGDRLDVLAVGSGATVLMLQR